MLKSIKKVNPREKWSIISAKKFIKYFYELCPDLFFIVKLNGKTIVGMWGLIKLGGEW